MFSTRVRFIGFLISLLMLLVGCNSDEPRKIAHKFPDHLKIFFTANTYGSLFPCGCHVPLGGLSRRAGVINKDKEIYSSQLVFDAGSFIAGSSNYDRFVGKWILKAYQKMGYHAVNIGARETRIPVNELREWDAISGGMLISANLIDSQNLPVTRKYLVRDIGELRVGITGMTMNVQNPSDAIDLPRIIEPVPPLKEVMDIFKRKKVDFVVLLADTGRAEIQAILSEIPDIDVVIQGQEFAYSGSYKADLIGNSRVVVIGDMGKRLGWLRLDFEPRGKVISEEASVMPLDNDVPTLASITELLVEFKKELKARREEFLGDPGNPFQRDGGPSVVDVLSGYVGSAHCQGCHPAYGLDMQNTGHDRAWFRLNQVERTSPECLPCHTTGYGIPTGLQDVYRDSHLTNVSCEACHGPAALHVRMKIAEKEKLDLDSLLPYEDPTGIKFSKEVPEGVCLKCHTKEWSPDFKYETWVKRVDHSSMPRRKP